MPETSFTVRWPDGARSRCYSPSLVVREHLSSGASYSLEDFVARTRTAMTIASQRVEAKHGFPCSRAAGTLADVERRAAAYSPDDVVLVEEVA